MRSIIDDPRDNGKIINLSNFSQCVHWLTLKFNDETLEREYPTKRVSPFRVTACFKIFLYLLIASIGIRRTEMTFLAAYDDEAALGSLRGEVTSLLLFLLALIVELIIHFYKSFNYMRGFFAMAYIYFSISFASYYTKKTSLFTTPMYFLV